MCQRINHWWQPTRVLSLMKGTPMATVVTPQPLICLLVSKWPLLCFLLSLPHGVHSFAGIADVLECTFSGIVSPGWGSICTKEHHFQRCPVLLHIAISWLRNLLGYGLYWRVPSAPWKMSGPRISSTRITSVTASLWRQWITCYTTMRVKSWDFLAFMPITCCVGEVPSSRPSPPPSLALLPTQFLILQQADIATN